MMRQKHGPNGSAEKHVKEINRKTRRKYSAEEKIRIVLEGLRGKQILASNRSRNEHKSNAKTPSLLARKIVTADGVTASKQGLEQHASGSFCGLA